LFHGIEDRRSGNKKPTVSLYHLSHGQREPVGLWFALSQSRTLPYLANLRPERPFSWMKIRGNRLSPDETRACVKMISWALFLSLSNPDNDRPVVMRVVPMS
jgi:hypothetical protein